MLRSGTISGRPGEKNDNIYMAYEGATQDWLFIPIETVWCTIEEITPDSGGIHVTVNPTYTSSSIRVTLLALNLA